MKKTIFILFFVVSIANAQFIKYYGVKAGFVLSQQDWVEFRSLNNSVENSKSFNFGLFLELFNHPTRSLLVALNYIQKGAKVNSFGSPLLIQGVSSWDIRLSYINISALVKVRYVSTITPFLFFGPKIDFEVNRTIESSSTLNFHEMFSKIRYGIKTGLGVEFSISSFKLFSEIIFDLDLNPLLKDDYLNISTKSYIFNLGLIL